MKWGENNRCNNCCFKNNDFKKMAFGKSIKYAWENSDSNSDSEYIKSMIALIVIWLLCYFLVFKLFFLILFFGMIFMYLL